MSKLRKSVIKKQDRSHSAQKIAPRASTSAPDSVVRDRFLFTSAKRSYLLAIVFFILAVLSAGSFWPFDVFRAAIGSTAGIFLDMISGVLSFALFAFIVFTLGNVLEIRGNVIEWKHLLPCLILVAFVAAWGGMISIAIFILGGFALLSYMWYMNR